MQESKEMISLKDWLNVPRTEEEKMESYQRLFYGMHRTCHYLAAKNHAYVPYLDIYNAPYLASILNQIYVDTIDESKVSFIGATSLPSNYLKEGMERNIEFLTVFAMSQYLGYDSQNGLLNKEFLQANFDQCKQFLPSDEVPYYEQVLVKGIYKYRDEFVPVKKDESSANLQGNSQSKAKERTYVKTLPGMGYNEDETTYDLSMVEDKSKAGFAQNIALTLLFLAVSMIVIGIILVVLQQ